MESVTTAYAISGIIVASLSYMMAAVLTNRTFIGFQKLGE